jgi:hypothetical protein
VILHAAGIDRSDRGAVGMADEDAAPEADLIKQFRQHVQRLAMHVVDRPRQRDGSRVAIAGARIDEDTGARRLLKFVGKVAPQRGGAEAFMQHDEGRRFLGCRTDHAVFEIAVADAEEAGRREGHNVSFRHSGRLAQRADPESRDRSPLLQIPGSR